MSTSTATPSDAASAPLLLRVEQVAARLNLSRAKVYRLIADGSIPSVLIGGSRRVTQGQLQTFVRMLEQQ